VIIQSCSIGNSRINIIGLAEESVDQVAKVKAEHS